MQSSNFIFVQLSHLSFIFFQFMHFRSMSLKKLMLNMQLTNEKKI